MKKIVLLLSLVCVFEYAFTQSKKELNDRISTLQTKVDVTDSKIQKLQEDFSKALAEIENLKSQLDKANEQISRLNSSPILSSETEENPTLNQSGKKKCKAITSSGKQCSRNADDGSDYCWQHIKTYDPGKNESGSSTVKKSSNENSSSGSGRVIHTGPRGGKYYINSNGKKVYIKK